jgi:molecular chaperone GrpE
MSSERSPESRPGPRRPAPPPEGAGPEAKAAGEAPEARAAGALDAAAARLEAMEDRLKRAQAEFVNETARIRQKAEDEGKFAVERLVLDLLPVFDALHSARETPLPAGGEGVEAAMREGLDLVERELMNVLARHGVRRIEAHGNPFDPGHHEALVVVDHPELPGGTVAQVLRPGFTLHGRVVRPAHVAVTRAPEEAGVPPDDAADGDDPTREE